jgi:ribosomal protein S18 acetylase RimI-like enzyme
MKQNFIYKKIETEEEIAEAGKLIVEYTQRLNYDLCFQHIDEELACFPEKYKEPEGAFFIAKADNRVVGCVGMRQIEERTCDMKRLFITDKYKGLGVGKILVERILEEAKLKNYKRMRLDTLDTMEAALNIYYKNGFYRIEPYYTNPNEGIVYLEKML